MKFPGSLPLAVSLVPYARFAMVVEEPSRRARALRVEAERCFRLAQGMVTYELADELEALGRVFESEAEQLASPS